MTPATAVVNGVPCSFSDHAPTASLAEGLRALGHVDVKIGCAEGTCGACTVLLDGESVGACLVPIARATGRAIETASAITAVGIGRRIAEHLAAPGALQCGYCIPGIVASATAAIERGASDRETLTAALAGHICRCTGYDGLLDALARAASGSDTSAELRPERIERATGATRFTADAVPVDHLTGLLLTATSPHAAVTIDASAAAAVPGAVAVLSADQSPAGGFSTNPHVVDDVLAPLDTRVFAGEARFVGDIVGLVVGTSPAAARAMAAAVVQHEHPMQATTAIDAHGARTAFECSVGDADSVTGAITAGATIHDTGRYEVEPGPPGSLERVAAAARWELDGQLTIWSTTQTPAAVPARLAALLGIDPDRIDVRPVAIGGGFGLKEEMFLEPVAAVASRQCEGRTVLVEATRAQLDLLRSRHHVAATVTATARRDGALVTRQVDLTFEAGAEVGHSALVAGHAANVALQLYPVPRTHVGARAVVTNNTPASAFRGYGVAELCFAVESQIDDLAHAAGVDPIEFRRSNALRAGRPDLVDGWTIPSFAIDECLDALICRGWREPRRDDPSGRWKHGRGMAFTMIVSSATSSAHTDRAMASCRLEADGSVVVETPVPEMGTGLHTTLAAIAAHRLGIAPTRVRVEQVRGRATFYDEGTFASRGIYVTANAVAEAAGELRRVIAAAGEDEPEQRRAEATYAAIDNGLVAGVQMVDVAVDVRTGRVRVDRVVSVHDVGVVVNEPMARGQVVGGVVQGLGMALSERFVHRDGVPVDRTMLSAGLPRSTDRTGAIEAVFVGDGAARGPLAAKGLGEAPLVGVMAAVGNAIRDATGVRLRVAPMTPERVLRALNPD